MPARNSTLDRLIDFVPNRILMAHELEMLQRLNQARDENGLGTIYREGATLNVRAVADGSSVSLSPLIPGLPMLVFVRGQFERIQPVSLLYDAGKNSGTDHIFLNYVLWRVTYNEPETIIDPALIDATTNEKIAEIGQIEITVSDQDMSLSSGQALDTSKEIERNQTPIVLYTLNRGPGGSITILNNRRVSDAALGDNQEAGLVRLSFPGSSTAIADNDPILSAPRMPPPRTLKDVHVSTAVQITPPIPQPNVFGIAQANVTGEHGISSHCIYDVGTKTILADLLGPMVTLLTLCYAQIQTLGTAPQPQPQPLPPASFTPPASATVPSDHIGRPLGSSGSHPAEVVSDGGGFTVRRSGTPGSVSQLAFRVNNGTSDLVALTHDGDVLSQKAGQSAIAGQPLGTLSRIAQVLAEHVNNHPTGSGGGVAQSYVDAQDLATLTAARTYTDQQVSAGGMTASQEHVTTNIPWIIIKLGNLEFAIGRGPVQDGAEIQLPFAGANFMGQVTPAQIFNLNTAVQLTCTLEDRVVRCFTRSSSGTISSGHWANFFGIAFRMV